ncbi:hypothetical protein [Lysinibacillus fusiformis]|uniref:hypothetical protein n=1 Tax=Lysinibacillus fusiformis TaxID=28031 RepID=UPI0030164346
MKLADRTLKVTDRMPKVTDRTMKVTDRAEKVAERTLKVEDRAKKGDRSLEMKQKDETGG